MTQPATTIAVALTRMTTDPWLRAFREGFAAIGLPVDVLPFTGTALRARFAIVWLPPEDLFKVERDLQVVFNLGAGVEGLLAMPGLPAQLPVVRLVDAGMAPKMAEYVCFHLARLTRGLDRFGGAQGTPDWNVDRPRGAPPTVGVMGLGAIGSVIAQAAVRFDYPVVGWSRTPRAIEGVRAYAGAAGLDEFLAATRILVDALPLTSDTANLLDRARLQRLPRGAHLINVGRGGTIVDDDLLAALDAGELGSAVLDVFRTEPLPENHPFWRHPRVTVTPHLSGPTPRRPAVRQIVDAIVRLQHGERVQDLPGWVDRARGY
jgi:glyoxylate/hydroxypyruvate reductase A